MNNEFVTLSDEELEMVAGGAVTQGATASAASAQTLTASIAGNTASAGLTLGAVQTGTSNTAAAASTADAANIVQAAYNTAVAANFNKSPITF